jgi:AcrR family transcriptional regulator
MPRRYEQQIRAETAEETRRRILDAVARRLRSAPTETLGLDEVAALARVSRSTIYLIFGSRAGLFDAFAKDLVARTGLDDLTKAVAHEDARRHMRDGIAAACTMYAQDLAVYRVLFSMNHLDPASVGGAVDQMEKNRAGGMAYLARRLAEDSVLREDITVDQANDVLWVLCSFETFDALYTGRRKSLDEAIAVIASTAEQAICRPLGPEDGSAVDGRSTQLPTSS